MWKLLFLVLTFGRNFFSDCNFGMFCNLGAGDCIDESFLPILFSLMVHQLYCILHLETTFTVHFYIFVFCHNLFVVTDKG